MSIKSLRMENFRQFKGTTKVEFACDPDQNVTIILGDNTFGKTTLLQAFNWCFYGKVVFSENPDFLLNLEIAGDMKDGDSEAVEVELVIIHDSVEYVITRTENYNGINGVVKPEAVSKVKVSYKQPDGQTESVKDSQVTNVINTILPEDLSTYFFFDTERVNSISTRRDVADAVKGLLGLTILDNAIKHLGDRGKKKSVLGVLYGSMDLDGDDKANAALDKIRTSNERLDLLKAQLDQTNTEIQGYDARKEILDNILRDNQTTASLQKRMDQNEKAIKQEERELSKTINLFFKEFNQNALYYFSKPLLETASAYLKEVKIDDKGIRE